MEEIKRNGKKAFLMEKGEIFEPIYDGKRVAFLFIKPEKEAVEMVIDRTIYTEELSNKEFANDLKIFIKKYDLARDVDAITKIELTVLEGNVEQPRVRSNAEIYLPGKFY